MRGPPPPPAAAAAAAACCHARARVFPRGGLSPGRRPRQGSRSQRIGAIPSSVHTHSRTHQRAGPRHPSWPCHGWSRSLLFQISLRRRCQLPARPSAFLLIPLSPTFGSAVQRLGMHRAPWMSKPCFTASSDASGHIPGLAVLWKLLGDSRHSPSIAAAVALACAPSCFRSES